MTHPLSCRRLSVRPSGGALLLQQIDAAFPAGSFTALVGPNGSGKSTLLRTLAGLNTPPRFAREGDILLEEKELRTLDSRERAQRLAFMAQHPPTETGLTLEEVILGGDFPWRRGTLRERPFQGPSPEAILSLLELLEMKERSFDTLSAGEKQRALFGRLMRQDPDILLLDEPTASLDWRHQLQLMIHLRDLASKGYTLVAAVHDLNLALRFAPRVMVIHQGMIAGCGPTRQILEPSLLQKVWGLPLAGGYHSVTASWLLDSTMT